MATSKYKIIQPSDNERPKDDAQSGEVAIQINGHRSSSNSNGNDVFHAVTHGNVIACQRLITPQTINIRDEAGHTLLHNIAKVYSKRTTGSDEIFSLLLQSGAKINAKDKEGNTPLHIAAREGHEELCQKLIDYQKNNGLPSILDSTNFKKMTPLHLAAQQGQAKVISLLLREQANADLTDNNRYLPLHYAAERGYSNCCELLSDSYPKHISKKRDPMSPLMLAAKEGHEWCCRNMKNLTQEDLDYQDKQGNTALHRACKKDFEKFVKQLVNKGAGLDVQNENGNTPVMEAISRNTSSCVTCLMDNGANLSMVNKQNKGVLHLAAERKADECMRSLLKEEGVRKDIDKKDNTGCTALLIAIRKDCDRCSLMLLEAGASPKEACDKELTPLHLATANTTVKVLQELLKVKDLDISPPDKIEAQTPLHLAAEKGSKEACTKLLKRGARISATNKHSRTVLHISAYHGHHDIVKLFIKKGAKARTLDNKKSTALHSAAAKGHLESCKILFEANKQLCTFKDDKGEYPLDVAFQKGQLEVFEFLLENLTFKSAKKIPQDMAKNLHSHMHKALKEGNRSEIEIILKSRFWETGLGISFVTKHENQICDNFRQLIKQYPDLAKLVMDNCVTVLSPLPKINDYNFRLLEDNYHMVAENESSENESSEYERDPFLSESWKVKPKAREYFQDPTQWKRVHPVHIMATCKCLNLLRHPLIKSWLGYKWNAYIRFIFAWLLVAQIFFIASLVGFMTYVHNWKWIAMKNITSQNMSYQDIIKAADENHEIENFYPYSLGWHIALLISTVLLFFIELYKIEKLRKNYLRELTNLFRSASVILAAIVLVPYPSGGILIKPEFPYQCGVVAFMLSCFCLISSINKIPSCAIFANLTNHFFRSYLKGLILISLIILTFAFIFHLLLLQDHSFDNFPVVIVRTVVWVLGDLAYDDTFASKKLSYPVMTNIIFLVFICMVGAFVVSLVKAPPSDPKKLAFNREAAFADYILNIETCHFNYRRKHAVAKYCDKDRKLWVLAKLEQLCLFVKPDSFVARGIYELTDNAAMMEVKGKRKPRIVHCIESILQYLTFNADDEEEFTFPDEFHDKLDAQNGKLDQLLMICKQLVHSYHNQNEQILELKQSYQVQNEQIAELKKQLGIQADDSSLSLTR